MKNNYQMRQGEILFIEVDSIPASAELTEAKTENGKIIVGHSETGHHHVIDISRSKSAQHLIDKTNSFISYLVVNDDCKVEHLRNFDTHESLSLKGGKKYQVRLRREYTPEGFRKVMD